MAKETAKIVGYEVAIGGIYLAMKTAEAALDAANKVLSLANKLGSGFLNTINKVIQGVLNVFYISKALLGIIVNGSQIFVKVNMELTVIGKQISVKEEVDMNKLIEKPIILLEELTINQIKDLIDKFICADEIAEDGTADLTFTHASDYTIVIDEAPMDGNGADDSTGTGSNNVTTESKEDSWNPLWIIIIGAIVIVAGLGIFFIIKKKEDKEDKDNQ